MRKPLQQWVEYVLFRSSLLNSVRLVYSGEEPHPCSLITLRWSKNSEQLFHFSTASVLFGKV